MDVLHNPSIKLPIEEDLAVPDPEAQLVVALHVIPDWTVSYLAYMTQGELPEDETLARQITRQSKSMTIANGELHHHSVIGRFCVASLLRRAVRFFVRFMKEIVVIMPVQSPLWTMDFIG